MLIKEKADSEYFEKRTSDNSKDDMKKATGEGVEGKSDRIFF